MDLGREFVEVGLSLVEPLLGIAEDPTATISLLELSGWDLDAVAGLEVSEVVGAANQLGEAATSVRTLLEGQPDSGLDIMTVGQALARLGEGVARLAALGEGWSPPQGLPLNLPALLVEDLLSELAILYVANNHPLLRTMMDLLGVVTYQTSAPITTAAGSVVRSEKSRPRVDFSVLGRLCTDPNQVLQHRLGLGSFRRPAADVADEIFPILAALLREAGLVAWYGDPGGAEGDLTDDQARLLQHLLRAIWVHSQQDGSVAKLDVALAMIDDGDIRTLVIYPTGSLQYEITDTNWHARADLTGSLHGLEVNRDGVRFRNDATPEISLTGSFDRPKGPMAVASLGSTEGTGIQFFGYRGVAYVALKPEGADVGFNGQVQGLRLVSGAPAGDGFLTQVIPDAGLPIDMDIDVSWTRSGGLQLGGAAGLEATFTRSEHVGLVRIMGAHLSVRATLGGMAALATLDAALQLGPFSAVVDRVGIMALLAPASGGGNLGPANVSISIAPPRGVALSIDASAVTGGGFLFFDPDKEQYAGALHLEFGDITLNAIGLITTRLPGGQPGFSLLIIIQAAGFTPVQLGFGFTLNGVGGLLGVNRTVDIGVLRAGIRNRTLDAILFSPDDPTPRATQIISALQNVFPPAPDRYVFGPMAIIGWGTPTILTIELAVLLELPAPVRLIVLGRLRAVLPSPEHAFVTLNMDSLGVVEFDRKELAVDATLYDSFVGPFALTGDMAARATWGATPEFALALGGLHPAFTPPSNFPELRRLALALSTGNNPRLRMEAYLALTSNTVQFGARLDFYVEEAGFSLEGAFAFDSLLNLEPFRLIAQIVARMVLKRGTETLMGIDVYVQLTGPAPWEMWGEARFKLLMLEFSVPFRARFGRPADVPPLQRQNPWTPLRAALVSPTSWSAQLPPNTGRLVALRAEVSDDETLVHPLGTLTVSQRVVPLERTLSLFGHTPPKDYDRFKIVGATGLQLAGKVDDYFAPAQFRTMTDAEKLSSPSFERMVSGVRLQAPGKALRHGKVQQIPLDYEQSVILDLEDAEIDRSAELYEPMGQEVASLAEHGPAGVAQLRTQGRVKFAPEEPGPTVADPEFTIATRDGLDPADMPELDGTYHDAAEVLRGRADHDRYQIVRKEELEPV